MKELKGSITALVTPFRNGAIDEAAYRALVRRQIEAGTHGLVSAGTTGEAATLSDDELEHAVRLCVETAQQRAPVIAGVGANDTAHGVELVRRAKAAGADAVLAVAGYYNRPNQAGLIAHYEALHAASDLPILIYNIPARSAVNMSVETMGRLAALPRIIGVKDATGDLARAARQRRLCGKDFIQLSGEDMTAVGFNAMGGRGCISVTSNIAPDLCAAMQNAALKGAYDEALSYQDQLAPLHEALFSDASPGPVKFALSLLGLCTDEMRLPMTPPSEESQQKVRAAMHNLGLVH